MRTCSPFFNGRHWVHPVALTVLAWILSVPDAAQAADLTVDCSGNTPGAFTSIQAAVDALPFPPPGGQNSIMILSDCTENVTISGQNRLWVGSPLWWGDFPIVKITAATDAQGNPGTPLSISGSLEVTLEKLTLAGGSVGLSVSNGSSVTGNVIRAVGNSNTGIQVNGSSTLTIWDGAVTGNGAWGISVGHTASLDLNGNTPWFPSPQPFLISGNGTPGTVTYGGIYTDGSLNIGGGVVIENNAENGIFAAGGSKVGLWAWHDEIVIQNNLVGLRCWESAQCITGGGGPITIKNNQTLGVQVTFGGVGVFVDGTSIEGNSETGVEVTAGSHARFEQVKVRNNGSTTEPSRAGIRVDGTSQVIVTKSTEVMGNIGPGIFADINSSLDISDATISSNTEEGIRLKHMSAAEIYGATAAAGNGGGPLTCDSTSLVITDLIGRNQSCANIEGGAGGGHKPRSASVTSFSPSVGLMIHQARQAAERSRRMLQNRFPQK